MLIPGHYNGLVSAGRCKNDRVSSPAQKSTVPEVTGIQGNFFGNRDNIADLVDIVYLFFNRFGRILIVFPDYFRERECRRQ